MNKHEISVNPIHLGAGATADVEPRFTGTMEWYADYVERHREDGFEGRLVSLHVFDQSWDMWEMHPNGSEVVLCTAGQMTLIQEQRDGAIARTTLTEGEYAINAPGVWHTADIEEQASAVFITAGVGTQQRPR